jgi:hypothetical protein
VRTEFCIPSDCSTSLTFFAVPSKSPKRLSALSESERNEAVRTLDVILPRFDPSDTVGGEATTDAHTEGGSSALSFDPNHKVEEGLVNTEAAALTASFMKSALVCLVPHLVRMFFPSFTQPFLTQR